MEKTLYSLLDVPEDASTESIQSAFQRLRQLHETKAAAGDRQANAILQAAREALLILSDKSRRTTYDFKLQQRRMAPVGIDEQASSVGKWMFAAVVLLIAAISSWTYYLERAELKHAEEEARAIQLKQEEQRRLREEEAAQLEAFYAAQRAAAEEQRRAREQEAWYARTRREGDEIMEKNRRAEEAARRQAAADQAKQDRARASEDAAARQRLEAEKRKLRELERTNRSW